MRDIIEKRVSEKLGVSEALVHEINMWQFEYLRKHAGSDTLTMELSGLGQFSARINPLRKLIEKYEKYKDKVDIYPAQDLQSLKDKLARIEQRNKELPPKKGRGIVSGEDKDMPK